LSNTTIPAQEQQDIVTRFTALEDGLNSGLVERGKEIKTALIALVARKHHFQVGPPGTAKSRLVRLLRSHIEGVSENDYFEYLLTKYSTPEEIFGPPSLKALEEDHYRRNTENHLAEAKLAFLDEIFKGNSSILNALLTLMNERVFHNDGIAVDVPLGTIFAASNELPMGDELNAMWDRLHFRHEIRPVRDGGNFVKMLQMHYTPTEVISWSDIMRAGELAEQVSIPDDVYDAFNTLRNNLGRDGIEPTERRFMDSLSIVKATAFLSGRTEVDIDDMRPLRHVMWYRPEDAKIVDRAVLELANPIDKAANDLLEQVEKLGDDLQTAIKDSDNPKNLAKQAVEIHSKLQKAKGEMDTLKKQAAASNRKSESMDILNERFVSIGRVLMKEVFGLNDKTEE
jgi:MoxR-like ATPase